MNLQAMPPQMVKLLDLTVSVSRLIVWGGWIYSAFLLLALLLAQEATDIPAARGLSEEVGFGGLGKLLIALLCLMSVRWVAVRVLRAARNAPANRNRGAQHAK